MTKKELLSQLVAGIQTGKYKTIAIYGHGASGKSTFAQELCQQLDGNQFNLLETDPYIVVQRDDDVVPKEFPDQKVTACLPVAHELASLERDVRALQAGMDLLTIDKPWQPATILSGQKRILIVEGMSVAFLPKELFDLSICFYTDDETELRRRLERDTVHRNRKAEWIERSHQVRRSQYRYYYQPYEKQADILVDQSGDSFQYSRKENHSASSDESQQK